jgi:RNA polymerase-associated protein CTR9
VIDHAQKAYKLDKDFPSACTTFASHFFLKRGYTQCESLAKKAIEYSDVAAITADGYFLLARKSHAEGEWERALGHYRRSDSMREGYLPAKMGIGQVQVLMKGSLVYFNFMSDARSHHDV